MTAMTLAGSIRRLALDALAAGVPWFRRRWSA
jgi:hypothetical protein